MASTSEPFAEAAQAAGKPVVMLKVGTSDVGAEAAKLHTGALVGSDRVADAIFNAHNILRVSNSVELIETLKILASAPPSAGDRLTILSHSGGAGVMAADAARSAGVSLPPLPDGLRAHLEDLLPPFASFANPLDMTGGASLQGSLMADCLRAVLADENYDAALLAVNLIWREGRPLLEALTALAAETKKPFAVSWVAPSPEIADELQRAPFPVFADPARAATAIARRLEYDAVQRRMTTSIVRSRPTGVPEAAGHETADLRGLLDAYGIRRPRECLARSGAEALEFFSKLGGPVALKIASAQIAHRTELDGVVLDLTRPEDVEAAYRRLLTEMRGKMPDATIEGILVQEMVVGQEVLVGVKRDPVFGPILALGPGGTLVELMDDLALHPIPLSPDQIAAMIAETHLARLLDGYRGAPAYDRRALIDMVDRVSWLVADRPAIVELDLNPVIVRPEGQGCVAVDYKLVQADD